jgi:hypothetical protein
MSLRICLKISLKRGVKGWDSTLFIKVIKNDERNEIQFKSPSRSLTTVKLSYIVNVKSKPHSVPECTFAAARERDGARELK